MKIKDIANAVEKIAPLKLAQDWDNVGLLIGDPNKTIKNILVTIDATCAVVEEAKAMNQADKAMAQQYAQAAMQQLPVGYQNAQDVHDGEPSAAAVDHPGGERTEADADHRQNCEGHR